MVPIFLLASSQGGLCFQRSPAVPCHVAPRGSLQNGHLLSSRPVGAHLSDFLFCNSQEKLLLKGSPHETKPLRVVSLLPYNIIRGVIELIVFTDSNYIQRGKDSLRTSVTESQLRILHVLLILGIVFLVFYLAASRPLQPESPGLNNNNNNKQDILLRLVPF